MGLSRNSTMKEKEARKIVMNKINLCFFQQLVIKMYYKQNGQEYHPYSLQQIVNQPLDERIALCLFNKMLLLGKKKIISYCAEALVVFSGFG